MTNSIKHPALLRPGDTIGIAAPASCFNARAFKNGLSVISGMGYKIKTPEAIFDRNGFYAGTDFKRAEVFMDLWTDPEINAVMCARGGFGSMRILPLLDFAKIAGHVKILVGYSDLTALLITISQHCNMVVFHGPVMTSLAQNKSDAKRLVNVLARQESLVMEASKPVVIFKGSAKGPVMGGNLTTLCHLAGTPFAPDLKGKILFLEDRGEALYRIDRMLFQMKISGMLNGITGVALGSFVDCGKNADIFKIFDQSFKDLNIPVLAGFSAGHGRVNQAFPMGCNARLDTKKAALEFDEFLTISE